MLTFDYHMHSAHSKDGKNTVPEMCDAAVGLGLREICFTEHLDFDRGDPDYGFVDWEAFAASVAEARARYAGRLVIRLGLEFDFRREFGSEPAEVLATMPCDFRIGSVHSAAGRHLYNLAKEPAPQDLDLRAIHAEYLAEVGALAASGLASAIGHFDYVCKQLPLLAGPLRDEGYWRKVEQILERCIATGTALEVNTHHMLDRGLGMAADAEILRRYRGLGGRLVTVGSDAHRREEIAHNFVAAEQALRDAGFDAVTGFDGRRPYQVGIA
jgi:histidinol-phosphatase (PHP family)